MNMSSLQNIGMRNNRLSGAIPRVLGNLTSLKVFAFAQNKFTGSIPQEVTNLNKLEVVYLQQNGLSGSIPNGVFNISTLRIFNLFSNHLSGNLALTLAHVQPNLESLILAENELTGSIPHSISNATKLKLLSLWNNHLTGSIPDSLGSLRFLHALEIAGNNLTSGRSKSPDELSFITSLTKCRHLMSLQVSENPLLRGTLPKSVGNFSSSLQNFHAYCCGIYGTIPAEIGNMSGLLVLSIFGNDLTGTIPPTFQGLHHLQQVDLSVNRLSGMLPSSLCGLPNLGTIYLFQNQLSGPVLDCFGNLTSLIILHLGANNLSSTLPSTLWSLKNILHLNLYTNSISGGLSSEIGNLKAAIVMDFSENRFSGDIPSTIGGLVNLINFSLAHNQFQGQMPLSIGGMLSLVTLDLSQNNLIGIIPKSLEQLLYLSIFNVSYNRLTGEIPSYGPFKNFTNKSFLFNNNEALCGDPKFHVPPCGRARYGQRKRRKLVPTILLAVGILMAVLVVVAGFTVLCFRRRDDGKGGDEHGLLPIKLMERISYYQLLQTTNGFNQSNIIGEGTSAVVYKGTFNDGMSVAIKVFKLQQEWSFKSFDTECKILRDLRHRNLTKVLSCCSTPDFKGLVLEYMPNGSLEKWLHGSNCFLDVTQRLNIMIDVACALEYLHYGCQMSVVHCDLKPSNVLLDEDLVAHVADFGIAKLLCHDTGLAHTTTLATLGYIAPEYGREGLISTNCDVYSYGIMLIETFTRRRPGDEMFFGNVSLRSWVKDALHLHGGIIEVVDANLLGVNEECLSEKVDCLTSVIELALICCSESPMERMDMKGVVVSLQKIKLQLLAHTTLLGERK